MTSEPKPSKRQERPHGKKNWPTNWRCRNQCEQSIEAVVSGVCVYSTQRFTPKVLVIPKGVYCVEEGDVGEFRYRHRRIEQRGVTKER